MNGFTRTFEEVVFFVLGIGCWLAAGTLLIIAILLCADAPRFMPATFASLIFAIYSCLYTGYINLAKSGVFN